MNPQQIIDQIAEKLSVPAALIWSVLTRQAYIEAVQDVLLLAALAAAGWWGLRPWFRYLWKMDAEELWIPWGIVAVLWGIAMVVMTVGAIEGLGYLFNPQYFALHEILSALKK